jgi:hypothetical protein
MKVAFQIEGRFIQWPSSGFDVLIDKDLRRAGDTNEKFASGFSVVYYIHNIVAII